MTNALNIAWELANFERVDVMILGGMSGKASIHCMALQQNTSLDNTGLISFS